MGDYRWVIKIHDPDHLLGMSTEEVGRALDGCGIAVRSGHHCAQPALRRFGVESTVRASLAFYNTEDEVHALGAALRNLTPSFRR